MIQLAIIISMASLGFRCITGPGMIFYFLRKPFENANKVVKYIAKPFILCSTCMASVHTIIWLPFLSKDPTISHFVLIMLVVAFLNTILFSSIELIQAVVKNLND